MPGDNESIYPPYYLKDVKKISVLRKEDYDYNEELVKPYYDYFRILSNLDCTKEKRNPKDYKTSSAHAEIKIIDQSRFENSLAAKIQITKKEFCVLALGPQNNQELANLLRDLAKNKVRVLLAIGKESKDFYNYFKNDDCNEINLSDFFKRATKLPKKLGKLEEFEMKSSFKFYHYLDKQLGSYYIMHVNWEKKEIPNFNKEEQTILALFLKYGKSTCHHCGMATLRSPSIVACKIMLTMLEKASELTGELLKANFKKSLSLISSVKTLNPLEKIFLLIPGLFEDLFKILRNFENVIKYPLINSSKAEEKKELWKEANSINDNSPFFKKPTVKKLSESDLLLSKDNDESKHCTIS